MMIGGVARGVNHVDCIQQPVGDRLDPPWVIGRIITAGLHPHITSPRLQLNYIMRADDPHPKIPLSAITDADVEYLHWFVNETFLAKTHRDEVYIWRPKPGESVIRVVDDHGRSDVRDVVVRVDS